MAKQNKEPVTNITELLTADLKCREENCKAAIDKALKDYNCELNAAVLVTNRGNQASVTVNAKPPQQ